MWGRLKQTHCPPPPQPLFGKDSPALAGEREAVSGPGGVRPQGLQMAVGGDSGPRVVGSGMAWDGRTRGLAAGSGLGSLGPLSSGARALRGTRRVWSWKQPVRSWGWHRGQQLFLVGVTHSPLLPHPLHR